MNPTRHPTPRSFRNRRRGATRESSASSYSHPGARSIPAFEWTVASTVAELDAVHKVRCDVYSDAGIPMHRRWVPREIGDVDLLPTTRHVLVRMESEAVATLRLALPNREVMAANGSDFGFEDEASFDFSSLLPLYDELGEVARVALRRHYRKGIAFAKLVSGLVTLATELGRRYLVGAIDCGTARRADADLLYQVAAARGLLHPELRVTARCDGADGDEIATEPSGPALYSAEQHARAEAGKQAELPLSHALEVFVHTMNARVIGAPARLGHFDGRMVIPVLADLSALPARTAAIVARHAHVRPATTLSIRKRCR